MSLLEITNLSHAYGDKALYKKASFDLYKGEHMGVVGQNGAGKSTLIEILTGEIIPDGGDVKWHPHINIGHLDQHAQIDKDKTIRKYLETAFSDLFKIEKEAIKLYESYAKSEDEIKLQKAEYCQAQLEARNFYSIDTQIDKVANGLGLATIGVDRLLSQLSGGQRAKVILAKLLLQAPDVLILDEPTNFLDKEHVDWLSDYLSVFENAFIVVSHDYEFLERISTCICDVEAQSIRKYHGKYSEFLKQKRHLREDYIRRYNTQQNQIKKTEDYIRKNIAGVNSRMAKGRRKQLERIERIDAPAFTAAKPSFCFREVALTAQEVLKVSHLEVGYKLPLLPALNFSVAREEKLVITGFNGIGKSTLLKTLVGSIQAISGEFKVAKQALIGYYEQDIVWDNVDKTPMQIISDFYPKLGIKEVRKQLSLCGVNSEHAEQEIGTLSGGEQSKVKMCKLILSPCNFLILDEPTNHLDAESKESLQQALTQFQGSVILVSHEAAFYREWADRVINIENL